MTRCALVTVATYNHLHFAISMARSVRSTWSRQPTIIVALVDHVDLPRPGLDEIEDLQVVPATALGLPNYYWQALRFSPAELCWALKPFLTQYALRLGYEQVVYCDTDIVFYDDAVDLLTFAADHDVTVTPHLLSIFPSEAWRQTPSESEIVDSGVMQAGLFVVRGGALTNAFLDAWASLCLSPNYLQAEAEGVLEQRAFNLVLWFGANVGVFRDHRFNVGVWNLHERPIRWSFLDGGRRDEWKLGTQPIVCFHFSGFELGSDTLSVYSTRHPPALNANVHALVEHYRGLLDQAGERVYADVPYQFDEIEGRQISSDVRRFTRTAGSGVESETQCWDDVIPLLRRATALPAWHFLLPAYLERVLLERPDLMALDGPVALHRARFLEWVRLRLWKEYPDLLLLDAFADVAIDSRAGPIASGLSAALSDVAPELLCELLVTGRHRLLALANEGALDQSLRRQVEEAEFCYHAFEPVTCLRLIFDQRDDLKVEFPDPLGQDLQRFRRWIGTYLAEEYVVPQSVIEAGSRLDPTGSLARLLSYAQREHQVLAQLRRDGLTAELLASITPLTIQGIEVTRSDMATLDWWGTQHADEVSDIVNTVYPQTENGDSAHPYRRWWCRTNVSAVLSDASELTPSLDELADALGTFTVTLEAELRRPPRVIDQTVPSDLPTVAPSHSQFAQAATRALARLPAGAARASLAPVLAPNARGINVFGYFHSPIGLGSLTRGVRAALGHAGFECREITLSSSTLDDGLRPEDLCPNFAFAYPRNLVVTFPHAEYDPLGAFPPSLLRGRETSAYLAWEQRELHPLWAERLRPYDRLFALSTFTADAIANGTGRPCETIPCVVTIDVDASTQWPRESFGISPDRFVVGVIFDASSGVTRKNPLGSVRAIASAFAGRHDVLVVLKVQNGALPRFHTTIKELVDELRHHELETLVITESMPKSQVDALISTLDLYVSLHRSEGFGYTIAEAMLLGTPVVATAYSGNMDFMSFENAYGVGYREEVIRQPEGPFQIGTLWAEPDHDEAVVQLRRAAANREEATARAVAAQQDVREMLSVEAVARRLMTLFPDTSIAMLPTVPTQTKVQLPLAVPESTL